MRGTVTGYGNLSDMRYRISWPSSWYITRKFDYVELDDFVDASGRALSLFGKSSGQGKGLYISQVVVTVLWSMN